MRRTKHRPLRRAHISSPSCVPEFLLNRFARGQYLGRSGSERGNVPETNELIVPRAIRVSEHRFERDLVGVEIRDQSDAHSASLGAFAPKVERPRRVVP
jgi:hypothetical protein